MSRRRKKQKGRRRLRIRTVKVTDHALVRYLERFYGLDMERLRQEVISDSLLAQYAALGDGVYPVENRHNVHLVDGVVATVYELPRSRKWKNRY